jgi:hypothetical protein
MGKTSKIVLTLTGTVVLGFVIAVGAVYLCFLNWHNPSYHGKRVHTWADQAIWDEDPQARSDAVVVLIEALREMRGEPLYQLVMRFCSPYKDGQYKRPLPKEVLPFLIEAVKCKNIEPGSYPAMAFEMSGGPDEIPALMEALKEERDREAKDRLKYVLDRVNEHRRTP